MSASKFGRLIKVDRLELKVIFVEGIVIIVIDFITTRFIVFICCRSLVQYHFCYVSGLPKL